MAYDDFLVPGIIRRAGTIWLLVVSLVAFWLACGFVCDRLLDRVRAGGPPRAGRPPWRLLWFWLVPGVGGAALVFLLLCAGGLPVSGQSLGATSGCVVPAWLLIGCRVINRSANKNVRESTCRRTT